MDLFFIVTQDFSVYHMILLSNKLVVIIAGLAYQYPGFYTTLLYKTIQPQSKQLLKYQLGVGETHELSLRELLATLPAKLLTIVQTTAVRYLAWNKPLTTLVRGGIARYVTL